MEVEREERARTPEGVARTAVARGFGEARASVVDLPPLPAEPLVHIRPGGAGLDLGEVWAYRELLYFFAWRDVKVRYKQTALGAAWAVLQPLAAMLVFTLFLGRVAGAGGQNTPYPLFAYAGLTIWTFFSNAVTNSGNSLVGNSNLVTKVYFPRAVIPASAVAAGLLDFVIASALIVPLAAWYGVAPGRNVVFAPLFVLLATLCALGVGAWASALNVKYRDVRYVLPFAVQVWMFASSVIVPSSFVPARWRWLLLLNPMSGVVEGFRACVVGQPVDWPSAAAASLVTLALVFGGLAYFRRVEETFADVV